MAITKNEATSNPAFEGDVTAGDAGEHSSMTPPTEHMVEADHAQSDDNLQGSDSQLSGNARQEATRGFEMKQCVDWMAGPMSAWAENDDYRDFFERGIGPETALRRDSGPTRENIDHDNDYDDNGGIPTAIGHSVGYIVPGDMIGDATFGIGMLIQRRF